VTEQLIKVPDIGGAEGAEVVEVLVGIGDLIELEQSLVVLESDKASMEIPASLAGRVLELRVAVGDAVSEGDVILVLEAAPAETESAPAASSDAASGEPAVAMAPEPAAQDEARIETTDSAVGEAVRLEVHIPDLGSDQGADLVEFLVTPGSAVQEGDSLVLLESDKASMEVPAPASGVLIEWCVDAGTSVQAGTLLAVLAVSAPITPTQSASEQPAAGTLPAPRGSAESHADTPREASTTEPAHASPQADSDRAGAPPPHADAAASLVYAGPAVRKLAREFGVDLNQVTGTGARGRIVKEDLQQFVAGALSAPRSGSAGLALPELPEIDFSRYGQIERVARSRIDKLTASNMSRAWLSAPHVTQFDDADISDMEAFRADLKKEAEQRGIRVTPLPFILKACAVALREHPKLKSSLADQGDTLIMKRYCHIGMAVETPAGLMVPVIRDVDSKSIWQIAAEVAELAERARTKQLKPDDMQGGVFTVSSLGGIGGRGFTPIINVPEVAILGVGRAAIQPVWDGQVFRPRTLLPLALSYDHRVINGGDGGRFLSEILALLADVRRLVM
jgi:pyruvate dehydrogenase E2 component (dihydrolipoamide acetyltransferase)